MQLKDLDKKENKSYNFIPRMFNLYTFNIIIGQIIEQAINYVIEDQEAYKQAISISIN